MAAASRPIAPPPRPRPAAADSLGASSALGMGPRNKVVLCAYCIYKAVGGVRSVPSRQFAIRVGCVGDRVCWCGQGVEGQGGGL